MGDNVTITEALGLSLLGLCVVFVMLILLMVVIMILSCVMGSGGKTAPAPAAAAPAAPQAVPEAPGSCGDIKLYNVSERSAAMIMAIVANELQVPLNTLRFKSIREIDEGGEQ